MARIKCFMLEPTEKVAVSLRRYSKSANKGTCPIGGYYHNAQNFIAEEPIERDKNDYIDDGTKPLLDRDDPRWPQSCACGYVFQESDNWQRFIDEIYMLIQAKNCISEMRLRGRCGMRGGSTTRSNRKGNTTLWSKHRAVNGSLTLNPAIVECPTTDSKSAIIAGYDTGSLPM